MAQEGLVVEHDHKKKSWYYIRQNKYSIYVLVVLMLMYLQNQCATFCLVATNGSMAQELKYGEKECRPSNATAVWDIIRSCHDLKNGTTPEEYCRDHLEWCESGNGTVCSWFYTGLGFDYQLLAGPFFIVIFSISGIPMGLLCELNQLNRKWMLAICGVLWSIMTGLGGLATAYWHQAMSRIFLGVFSAGCVPFCASIIADYFSQETRGAAMGFYNWGVYVGYSMTFVLLIAEKTLGWRWIYFLVGAPGVCLSLVVMATIREPVRDEKDGGQERALVALTSTLSKLRAAVSHFLSPTLLVLCLAGGIRNGSGFVWAFNIVPFFDTYHPGTQIEQWMSWLPLVFGSIGAFGGGYISDKLSAKRGIRGRLVVLIACLILSAPFAASTLFLPMPWAMIGQIPAYVIGEMWIGVCVAVVIDLVPADLTASAVAVYFFIIQMIGGNMNLLEPPFRQALDMQYALLILYPGTYMLAAILFGLALLLISVKSRPAPDSAYVSSTSPMINDEPGKVLRL